MKCPHCLVAFHARWSEAFIPDGHEGLDEWVIESTKCAACYRPIMRIYKKSRMGAIIGHRIMVYPKGIARSPLPPEVPDDFASDYKEACLVFADSEKASAALSRRCLQYLLREKAGTKKRDLADQIQEVFDSKTLPSHLADAIDAIRAIGNFAAHPTKSTNTGEIIDVEPGEAEWLLDTIESLFDFYFVSPVKLKEKRDALNKKLKDAGKPPIR